jgi:transposase
MTRECHVRFCARLRGRFLGSTRLSASQKGATSSANLYSLIETAKANNLEPYGYLKKIFTQLPNAQTLEQIEALLPWNVKSVVN